MEESQVRLIQQAAVLQTAKTDAAIQCSNVTDIGGVDDRSFNQSAWEGLEAWGKEHVTSLAVLVDMTVP